MSPGPGTAAARRAAPVRATALAGTAAALAATTVALVVVELRAPSAVAVTAARLAYRLDPNTASRDELLLLPNVGPRLADEIIAYRAQAAAEPAFRTPADLGRVRGFGPARIARVAPLLRWPDGREPPAPLPAADERADDPPSREGDAP